MPRGTPSAVNGLDRWKHDGEQYVENWVFDDMVNLFDRFGINLFERMNAPTSR